METDKFLKLKDTIASVLDYYIWQSKHINIIVECENIFKDHISKNFCDVEIELIEDNNLHFKLFFQNEEDHVYWQLLDDSYHHYG